MKHLLLLTYYSTIISFYNSLVPRSQRFDSLVLGKSKYYQQIGITIARENFSCLSVTSKSSIGSRNSSSRSTTGSSGSSSKNKSTTNKVINKNRKLKSKDKVEINKEVNTKDNVVNKVNVKEPEIINLNFKDDEGLGFQNPTFKSGFVTILGNPNVGKSTLLNALLKEKLSIVSAKPQTTRHRILGVLTEKDYQIVFSDTPGMMLPAYKLQEAMMDSVRGAASDADVIVLMTDVYGEALADEMILQKLQNTTRPIIVAINKMDLIQPSGKSALTALNSKQFKRDTTLPQRFDPDGRNTTPIKTTKMNLRQRLIMNKLIREQQLFDNTSDEVNDSIYQDDYDDNNDDKSVNVVLDDMIIYDFPTFEKVVKEGKDLYSNSYLGKNRVELASKPKTLEELKTYWNTTLPNAVQIGISAQNRTGVDQLMKSILSHMSPGPKYFPDDQLTNRDERFFAAEIVRETILTSYQDEVPYSCEVVIDTFTDKSPGLSVIEAFIFVNRSSHKAILIGKGGMKLKELGTAARLRLETFLDRKVFLSLRVKLDEEWRSSDDSLKKYGYIESDFG